MGEPKEAGENITADLDAHSLVLRVDLDQTVDESARGNDIVSTSNWKSVAVIGSDEYVLKMVLIRRPVKKRKKRDEGDE